MYLVTIDYDGYDGYYVEDFDNITEVIEFLDDRDLDNTTLYKVLVSITNPELKNFLAQQKELMGTTRERILSKLTQQEREILGL